MAGGVEFLLSDWYGYGNRVLLVVERHVVAERNRQSQDGFRLSTSPDPPKRIHPYQIPRPPIVHGC